MIKLKELEPILSRREIEVVWKRLKNGKLKQVESNYIRNAREKLRAAEFAAKIGLLGLLEYRRRKYERDGGLLREKIVGSLGVLKQESKAVVLYGSYIRNKHVNYRDIDVMIVLKKKFWMNSAEKNKLEKEIAEQSGICLDVQLVVYRDLVSVYPYSPLLQTELKEREVIYGKLKLEEKGVVDRYYLYRKLLEVESVLELGKEISSRYVYNALKTCLSIELFLRGEVGNELLVETMKENIGGVTVEKLKDGSASFIQVEIALKYLNYLYRKLERKLNE